MLEEQMWEMPPKKLLKSQNHSWCDRMKRFLDFKKKRVKTGSHYKLPWALKSTHYASKLQSFFSSFLGNTDVCTFRARTAAQMKSLQETKFEYVIFWNEFFYLR